MNDLQTLLIDIVIPIGTLWIMFAMGLSLRPSDFVRVAKAPRALAVAMVGQYIVVPVLAVALIAAMSLPPAIAVGALLVCAIPGGVVSNGFVYVGKGNAALSVSLTAISQFFGMVTIPLYVGWALATYYTDVGPVSFNVLGSLTFVFLVNIVPMGLGMLLRAFLPKPVDRIEPTLRRISVFLLFVVILLFVWPNIATIVEHALTAGALAMVLCIAGVIFGNVAGAAVGLDGRDGFTIGVEVGVQNLALAVMIATILLDAPELAIYAAVYSVVTSIVMPLSIVVKNRFANADGEGLRRLS